MLSNEEKKRLRAILEKILASGQVEKSSVNVAIQALTPARLLKVLDMAEACGVSQIKVFKTLTETPIPELKEALTRALTPDEGEGTTSEPAR